MIPRDGRVGRPQESPAQRPGEEARGRGDVATRRKGEETQPRVPCDTLAPTALNNPESKGPRRASTDRTP